jgi:hypothetical protein
MGILHEKNWLKTTPPSLSHEGRRVGGFFNINVNQIGHFEEGQKFKSKWGEKLQLKLMLAYLVNNYLLITY